MRVRPAATFPLASALALLIGCGGGAGSAPSACAQAACDPAATCDDSSGAARCACPAGMDGDGKVCRDHDECADTPSRCSANALCTNTPGSFTCACKPGYAGDGVTCTDVNECATMNGGCDANAVCTNTAGGRTCACKAGFSGDGVTCGDTNECATNNGGCSASAVCANGPGGRSCACRPGYTGDGITCTDIDECQTSNGGCDPNAACANTAGGRTCSCEAGYTGDGVTCADVDECQTNNGGCSADALCSNTPGSHVCTCKTGFQGDGVTCTDVDECQTGNGGCDAIVVCHNLPGSFTCGDCPPGYNGGGAGGCNDVDECTAGTANCSTNATCANTPGAFTCACKPGFTGDGVVCSACTTCAAGQYQTGACTASSDTTCAACPAGCASCTDAATCTSCAPGNHLVGGACVACSSCSPGQYQGAACTPTQDTACNACATCGAGQFQTAACGGSSDTACGTCSRCGAGEYQTAACGPTSDATCAACDADCTACTGAGSCTTCAAGHFLSGGICVTCSTCAPGQYMAAACTATQDTTCNLCTTCGAGQFQTAACTATSDTACATCSACAAGTHETAACGGTSDRVCSACTTCTAGQYQAAACTAASDRVCATCSSCGAGQYQAAACGPTSNTLCATCTTCAAGQFQTAACTATSDAACATCSTCGAGKFQSSACGSSSDTVCGTCANCPMGKYVATACGGSSDTVCGTCDAHCDACTGAGACTTCSSGYAPFNGNCVRTGTSCKAILTADAAAPDGIYQLDPDGAPSTNAFFAYCDMTTDGGGWMKILQYANAAYTPSASAIGTIAVAGTPAAAKLSDANINSLASLGAYREYRMQGGTSTKKLFMKVNTTWNDLAQGHNLIPSGTGLACEGLTNCTYVSVTTPAGRPTPDSNDWTPSSIAGANDLDRYFTDYSAVPQCFATGSTTTRCWDSGASTGHALIANFSMWARETSAPVPAGATIYYPLDENTGTVIGDLSGNSRGATMLSGSWTPGHTGSAVLGALRTNATVPVSTAVTVSLWVRRDGPGSGYSRVLSWASDALEIGDAGTANSLAVYTPAVGWQPTGKTFGTGFHHVAVTAGGGTLIVYQDGVQIFTIASALNLNGQMSIGIRSNNVEAWNGALDLVRVYDHALTAAEILALSQE